MVDFNYDAKRYEDKSFIPEDNSVTKQAQAQAQRGGRKKLKVNLEYNYDASRYSNKSFIPESGSHADVQVAKPA